MTQWASFYLRRRSPLRSRISRAKRFLAAQSGSWTSHQVMMATLIDLTRSTFHNLNCKLDPERRTQNFQSHHLWPKTMKNCLISKQHWSPIVTCYNGTLLGSYTDSIINTMPNRQPPMLGALLGLARAPKEFLLQQTMVGKINMVALRRLSWTSGFVGITSSTIWRALNAHGYSIGPKYRCLACSEWHSSDTPGDTSTTRCGLQALRLSIHATSPYVHILQPIWGSCLWSLWPAQSR
jgi:hypothetical protein